MVRLAAGYWLEVRAERQEQMVNESSSMNQTARVVVALSWRTDLRMKQQVTGLGWLGLGFHIKSVGGSRRSPRMNPPLNGFTIGEVAMIESIEPGSSLISSDAIEPWYCRSQGELVGSYRWQ